MSEREIWTWLDRIEKAAEGLVTANYYDTKPRPWFLSDGHVVECYDTPEQAEAAAREWPAAMRDA
jgi:hypothetical protein